MIDDQSEAGSWAKAIAHREAMEAANKAIGEKRDEPQTSNIRSQATGPSSQ